MPRRIHERLMWIFALILLIPCLGIPILTLGYLRYDFIQSKVEASEHAVLQHVRLLESQLETRSVEVLMLGQFPEMRKYVNIMDRAERTAAHEALFSRLQTYLHKHPGVYAGIRLLDVDGKEMLNLRADPVEEISRPDVDFSHMPFFVDAMHLAAIQGQSVPVHMSIPDPPKALFYSSLVMTDEGIIAGVLVLEIRLDTLLKSLKNGGPGKLYRVLDSYGRVIYPGSFERDRAVGHLHFAEDILEEGELAHILSREAGAFSRGRIFPEGIIAFARARPMGQGTIRWTAVYQVSLADVDNTFVNAAWMVLLIVMVGLAISILVALYFSRQISRPVQQLATAANDISHGYWDTLLPENHHLHEVSELTEAFSSMSRQLRAAHQNLLKKIEDLGASENNLAREKERLAVTLRSIGDAVLATDLNGAIEALNPRASELLGYAYEEAKGKTFGQLADLVNRPTGERITDPVDQILRELTAMVEHHDLLLMRPEGDPLSVELTATPIRNMKSEVIGVVIVLRDVSEHRTIQLEKSRLEKLESLGVLAGGIAHDFNNLIAVVMGDLSLLADTPEQIKEPEVLEDALKALDRARALTGQLLTFSKGGAPVKHAASIVHLIEETAKFSMHGSKARLNIDAPVDLWTVDIDSVQMQQVFQNLTINALQSMPDGGELTIHMQNVQVKEDDVLSLTAGAYVLVKVQDSGIGIAVEDLPHIFDPYFTTKSAGHGLGLSTVYSIIRAHGGHITVKSSRKQGTTFTLYLPALPHEKPKADKPDLAELAPVNPMRILVLDDDMSVQATCRRLLTHLGHHVDCCSTTDEVLRAFKKGLEEGQAYDLLILDLTIPGGDGGLAALRAVHELDPKARALVSSGYSQDPVMSHYQKYGFVGVLQKPFTLKELRQVLSQL
ncbi:MAG: PAS domain-containing protein [Kiritimatiellae bacterium]|nr:PAS domain-containing protein [Kiritimatiellia bacterium]